MRVRVADENADAERLIPPTAPDGSGIGVNYVDAYIKPLNAELEHGQKVTCKRKGLKIIVSIGDKTGEAVIRRVDHGPDVRDMLREALESAAQQAGSTFHIENGGLYLDL